MVIKKPKKIVYPKTTYHCDLMINNRQFVWLKISQYYKSKLGRSTVNDEIIQELVKQLDNQVFDPKVKPPREYFSHEPLYIGYRAYNLMWYFTTNEPKTITIINCYREKKYDK